MENRANLTEEEIIDKYLKNGAWRHRIFAPEWELYIDSAIAINPDIPYLYQQKAMPYFKQQKYEIGLKILDRAVDLNPAEYIDYRAFIKCIFARTYRDAIKDFLLAKQLKGEHSFIMDHSYDFYMGLSYIQLNEFDIAIKHLSKSIDYVKHQHGEKWVHHLDLFYMGIAYYELQRYAEAIGYFDRALASYPQFADAKYYKAISLYRTQKQSMALILLAESEKDRREGFTINEVNAKYEKYPYQISQEHIDILRK